MNEPDREEQEEELARGVKSRSSGERWQFFKIKAVKPNLQVCRRTRAEIVKIRSLSLYVCIYMYIYIHEGRYFSILSVSFPLIFFPLSTYTHLSSAYIELFSLAHQQRRLRRPRRPC